VRDVVQRILAGLNGEQVADVVVAGHEVTVSLE
jgi:hypothetical protein